MRQVTIRQLQTHISEELKVLPFMITRRGKPAAVALNPVQVSSDGVCTGDGSIKDVLASKGLTREEKRVLLKKIAENPKTRDADKVKAIAEDNRLDTSMNDTGDKSSTYDGDRAAADLKAMDRYRREAMAEANRVLRENLAGMGEGAKAQTFETVDGRRVGVLYILPGGDLHPDSWIECAEDVGPRGNNSEDVNGDILPSPENESEPQEPDDADLI